MSTSSSSPKPAFKRGEVICGYEVIKKLGSGGFGAVYQVKKDGVEMALKTEFVEENEDPTLKNEVGILKLMQWSSAFCRLYAANKVMWDERPVNIMVMTLCGRSLTSLRRMMPKRHFTKETAARLSLQLLEALRDLHQTGIVHRDVKGSNCGWHPPTRRIILYDLGFSRKFLEWDETNTFLRLRSARKSTGFMGTSKYCSVYAHEDMDQGRRDDLWAWLYSSLELFRGSLPWSNEEKTIMVSQAKKKLGKKWLLKCPREISLVAEHVRQLKFDSCPDYPLLIALFQQMLQRLEIEEEDPMDFEEGSPFFEQFFKNRETSTEEEATEESSLDGSHFVGFQDDEQTTDNGTFDSVPESPPASTERSID